MLTNICLGKKGEYNFILSIWGGDGASCEEFIFCFERGVKFLQSPWKELAASGIGLMQYNQEL
jgi:hypothetical protein